MVVGNKIPVWWMKVTSLEKLGKKMSQVFEGYERQYCELSANLSNKITSATLLNGGETNVLLQGFCLSVTMNFCLYFL